MAARFWRLLLGWQLLYAAAVTGLVAATTYLSPGGVVLTALAAVLSAPLLLVTLSFVTGGVAARGARAPAMPLPGLVPALLRETAAFLRAALAMIAEPHRRPPGADAPGGAAPARPVLLIHGIVCNRGIWRPLIERLRAEGFAPIRAVDLEPLFADIDSHAACVVRELRELERQSDGAPVAIVAHSMGGLVARAALRSIGPDLVSRIVTIAAPHHGTLIARLFRSTPARQMCPQSPWLRSLNQLQEGHLPVPVTSIYSLHDNLVVPPGSARLDGARRHELRGLGHLSLLSARESIDCTLAALLGA
jgi:predicted alpha/beta hydrolase family esterase